MVQDYDGRDGTTLFVQTANPTPPIGFGWRVEDYDKQAKASTFVQTANPTPPVSFGWDRQ